MEGAMAWAWPAIVGWLMMRAYGQRNLLQKIADTPSTTPPKLAVIVPARDEAANIARCLESLAAQAYPPDRLTIIVVDDHSSDDTRQIANRIAAAHENLKVIASPPLPPGWIGKSHACWIGAEAAPSDAEWLCFLDADMRTAPELMGCAVETAESQRLDLLSLAPHHELGSFAERLMIPCGLYCLSFCRDLRRVQSAQSMDATVTGQFMLTKSEAYKAVGGHASIKTEICEDVALARLMKRAGRRVELWDGRRLLSTRMYTGWDTLWPGLAKNLVDVLGGPLPTLAAAAAAVALAWAAWLLPLAYGWRCMIGAPDACAAIGPTLAGSASALGLHIAGAAFFEIPLWYGFLFPLGYTAGAILAVDSIWRRWRGRVSWKGRIYP